VSDVLTLANAQLAVAREYGFASWTRLRDEVAARTAGLARQAEAFCEASIRDGTGRAARMLVATPELARYSFATAVILGDAGRVRTELGRDPGLATEADTRTGWAPLHAAGASRWHRLDPARAEGLLAVARMLLDAGADPNGRTGEAGGHGGWTPLRCAVAGAATVQQSDGQAHHMVGEHRPLLKHDLLTGPVELKVPQRLQKQVSDEHGDQEDDRGDIGRARRCAVDEVADR